MRVVAIIVLILVNIVAAAIVGCLKAAGRADKWSEEIIKKEHGN